MRRVLMLLLERLQSCPAGSIAARRHFDLYDLGAHLGEDAGAYRSRNELREIQDAVAFEHSWFVRHERNLSARNKCARWTWALSVGALPLNQRVAFLMVFEDGFHCGTNFHFFARIAE